MNKKNDVKGDKVLERLVQDIIDGLKDKYNTIDIKEIKKKMKSGFEDNCLKRIQGNEEIEEEIKNKEESKKRIQEKEERRKQEEIKQRLHEEKEKNIQKEEEKERHEKKEQKRLQKEEEKKSIISIIMTKRMIEMISLKIKKIRRKVKLLVIEGIIIKKKEGEKFMK